MKPRQMCKGQTTHPLKDSSTKLTWEIEQSNQIEVVCSMPLLNLIDTSTNIASMDNIILCT